MPPFVAVLKRYRSVLAGIHELTSSDGQNPLVVDDRALAADTLPIEVTIDSSQFVHNGYQLKLPGSCADAVCLCQLMLVLRRVEVLVRRKTRSLTG